MKVQRQVSVVILVLASSCNSLAFTPGCGWSRRIFQGGCGRSNVNGFGNPPPPPPPRDNNDRMSQFDDGESDSNRNNILAASSMLGLLDDDDSEEDSNQMEEVMNNPCSISVEELVRGGSQKTSTNNVVAGSKSSLQLTQSYWSDVFQNLKEKVDGLNPFKKTKGEDEIDPSTIPVQAVIVPGSDILPDSIVRSAAQRSGMVGSVMKTERVKECARQLKKWYVQRGYVLHSVTGATLHSENGTATLAVQEPIISSMPMDIKFTKEMLIDPESGEAVTRRKYREKLEKKKGRSLRNEEWAKTVQGLNRTLVETEGRTSSRTLSKRLGLSPGNHFQWNGNKWKSIAQSGIFSKVFAASPIQMDDGTVQFQVLCQESAPRNLEYGVTKSLYTGNWEGELDFKHGNILGGGESLGILVRRGAKDPEPSLTLRFSDDKFGMKGGYDAEIFKDYIAVDDVENGSMDIPKNEGLDTVEDIVDSVDSIKVPPVVVTDGDDKDDTLLCREGIKFSLRGPISTEFVENSSASASIERTSTRKGKHETIGSGTLSLGPFVRNLPLGARTSLLTSATSGARVGERLFPFSSGKVTSRQIFPLFTESASNQRRQADFALQHIIMAATGHLPRHEANAAGFSARVRGYSQGSNGPVDSSIVGSAEVRVPITIPSKKVQQDGILVFFGDWMVANRQDEESRHGYSKDKMFGKSSIGVGLRKSIQGIPIKYDVSLTKDGKIGAFASLGQDWGI